MQTEIRAQVWAKTNGQCWYCGKLMNPWNDFTVDHMDPRKNGGGDELANLGPACQRCNSRKNAKNVEEYRGYLVNKADVRFWGEQAQTKALVIIEQEVEDSMDWRSNDNPFASIYDVIKNCFWYCRAVDTEIFPVLYMLIDGSDWEENLTAVLRGHTGMDDLISSTHQSETRVLASLFKLNEHRILHMNIGNTNGIDYMIITDQISYVEMCFIEGAHELATTPRILTQ